MESKILSDSLKTLMNYKSEKIAKEPIYKNAIRLRDGDVMHFLNGAHRIEIRGGITYLIPVSETKVDNV